MFWLLVDWVGPIIEQEISGEVLPFALEIGACHQEQMYEAWLGFIVCTTIGACVNNLWSNVWFLREYEIRDSDRHKSGFESLIIYLLK